MGAEGSGMEWRGMDRKGTCARDRFRCAGLIGECTGEDWSGGDRKGKEGSGVEWNGKEPACEIVSDAHV